MKILHREDAKQPERRPSELRILSSDCIVPGHPAALMQGKRVRSIEIVFVPFRENGHVDQSAGLDRRRRKVKPWETVADLVWPIPAPEK